MRQIKKRLTSKIKSKSTKQEVEEVCLSHGTSATTSATTSTLIIARTSSQEEEDNGDDDAVPTFDMMTFPRNKCPLRRQTFLCSSSSTSTFTSTGTNNNNDTDTDTNYSNEEGEQEQEGGAITREGGEGEAGTCTGSNLPSHSSYSSSAMSGSISQQWQPQPLHVHRRNLKFFRRNSSKSDPSITLFSKSLGSTSSSVDTNTTHTTTINNESSSSDYSRCLWDIKDAPTSTPSCHSSFSRLATSEVISELQKLDDDLERIGTCSHRRRPPPQSRPPQYNPHPTDTDTDTDTDTNQSRQFMDNSIIERVDQNGYYPIVPHTIPRVVVMETDPRSRRNNEVVDVV